MSELHAEVPATRAERVRSVPPRSHTVLESRRLVRSFVGWLDEFGELSNDPHDLWASSLGTRAKSLYYRRRLLGTTAVAPFVLVDLVAPHARSLVRRPQRFPIADAHYALGFFHLGGAGEGVDHIARGRAFLAALERTRSSFVDPAWGYPFNWPSRHGIFPAGTPFITTVPYCYEAFEAGYTAVGDGRYLDTMEGIARFAARDIASIEVGPGADASAYSPLDRRQVVNASAYRGFLLTSAGRRFEREDWLEAGARNIAFVLRTQRKDGSWPYSVDGEDFVDNFHSCFILKSLAKVWALAGDDEVGSAVQAGYAFYLDRLLDDAGLPVPFALKPRLTVHRRDLYDYAEGVGLAYLLRDEIAAAAGVLERLVADLGERWQLPDGHFVTRELVVGRNTVPYHRWAQSQTFRALAQVAGSAS